MERRWVLTTLVLALAPLVTPLDAQDRSEAANLRALADSMTAAGRHTDAVAAYERLAALRPEDGEVHYRLGNAHYRATQYAAAAPHFLQAARRGYRIPAAYFNMACSYALAGMADSAYAYAELALEAGYNNRYSLLLDTDLDLLRGDSRWQRRMASYFGTGEAPELSQPVIGVVNTGITKVAMTDGVHLATEVMLPRTEGPFPTVLVRTPYGKGFEVVNGAHWAARGYAVVVQDVRGRGDSEGEFVPWHNERRDGAETLRWIRAQPWSNGKIGMIGASYVAQVQWLAAAEAGAEGPDAIIPLVSGTDPFLDTPYDHGILKLSLLGWSHAMARPDADASVSDTARLRTLPVSAIDNAYLGAQVGIWDDWVRRDQPKKWRDAEVLRDMARLRPAVLHVSGLWDVEAIGTLRNWQAMQEAGKEHRWLVFGPWPHQNFYDPIVATRGEIRYEEASDYPMMALWVRFFDTWLKGREVGWDGQPRAHVFVTGENRWRALDAFPSPATQARRWYPRAVPTGIGAFGSLGESPTSGSAGYRYDPASAPLQGDPTFDQSVIYPHDPAAQDELRFASDPLGQATTVVGAPRMELDVSTDAVDTDLFVFVLDIDQEGTARVVGHPGKLRLAFRHGSEPTPMVPGRRERLTIEGFPIAHRFAAGHRIGVVIRSDWFPRYVRNLNTGESQATGTRSVAARQTVHFGQGTALVLPVVPGS